MSISRKAQYKFEANQKANAQPATYTLPPSKKSRSDSTSPIQTENISSYIKSDFIKTVIVGVGILLLELVIWWRMK